MNYTASISDFFKSPKWMMNLLLGGVCVLIPIVGPMVVLGWLITGFWARRDENFETFPDFDFSHFGKYLERGLWPFLVTFVVSMGFSIVMMPLAWVLMIPTMLIGGLSSGGEANASSCLGLIAMLLMMLVLAIVIVAMMLVLVPLKIRASLTQDFAKSFDVGFVKRFLALTWKEIVLSSLFVMITSVLFVCLGMIVFCVGMYFAVVLIYFSWTHLHKQLYTLYLSRGGEPVPFSPKLNDAPPAMPVA
ncbi:MAG TPA: DUF4013 domain-containing protein [Chthoniobacterales bacterium]